MMERTHRANAGHRVRAPHLDALAAIKAARAGGARRVDQVKLSDPGDVYAEVDEEEYKSIVLSRRSGGEFVIDDGADSGYMDDGEEHWEAYVGEELKGQKKLNVSKIARQSNQRKKTVTITPTGPVSGAFLGSGRAIGPVSKSRVSLTEADTGLMASLLGELDAQPNDDDDDEYMDNDDNNPARFADVALLSEEGKFLDTLIQVYEEDEAMAKTMDRAHAKRRLAGLRSSTTNQNSEWSVLPPVAPTFDYNDSINDTFDTDMDTTSSVDYSNPEHSNLTDQQILAALEDDPSMRETSHSQPKKKAKSDFAFGATRVSASSTVVDSVKLTNIAPLADLAPAPDAGMQTYDITAHAGTLRGVGAGSRIASAANRPCSWSGESEVTNDPSPITDNSLTFYYYDAHEDPMLKGEMRGTVFLFGKALVPGVGANVGKPSTTSTCLQLTGMQRSLFFLPRKYRLEDASDETSVTDEVVKMADVYAEVSAILRANNVKSFGSRPSSKSYCFDRDISTDLSSCLDSESGVPDRCEYLEVEYPFTNNPLPRELTGRTFSRVFGTQTSPLELFLLKTKLMGPGWLRISNIAPVPFPYSHCRHEYRISDLSDLSPAQSPPDIPYLSAMTISIKTVRNKDSEEIVMLSYSFNRSTAIDGVSDGPIDENGTFWRPVDSTVKLPSAAKFDQRGPNGANETVQQFVRERVMLIKFVNLLTLHDPDIIIAHDLHFSVLGTFAARCRALGVTTGMRERDWSVIGRYRVRNLNNSRAWRQDQSVLDEGIGAGRLQIDTQLMAKEFLAAQRMYTLTYLADTQCNGYKREEIDSSSIPARLTSVEEVGRLSKHTQIDCAITLQLMVKMQLLPLTKQVTNLCGNTWSKTLRSKRSERVESLLLHEFFSLDFIIPEKYTAKEKREKQERREQRSSKQGDEMYDDDDNGAAMEDDSKSSSTASAKKSKLSKSKAQQPQQSQGFKKRGKPLYSGGLVLEPKRGFYDKYVLLLDFNSLYPSIIQEYNICWTTVPHWRFSAKAETISGEDGEEEMAESSDGANDIPLPEAGTSRGHLPRIIAGLVERRKEVKRLMKSERSVAAKMQLDIRQRALKLIANAMYGCLGFVAGRFYCSPLAALVTSQGRATLTSSVELANTLGAHVIYGDTDSIMVDTAAAAIDEAIALGNMIAKEINKKHSVLFIEIDSIYKNMLLLKKKKYAALKVEDDGSGRRCEKREVKGLDLVRRDWCELSRTVGDRVLNHLLSSRAREEIVESIHTELDTLGKAARANEIPLKEYVITKSLTKAPHEYAQAKDQPHVQVALAMMADPTNAVQPRAGDVIPYVICVGDCPLAQRAYHPNTVKRANGSLVIDIKWYLENQIVATVARLCSVIEELDKGRIAHHLGLDANKFRDRSHDGEDRVDEDDEFFAATAINADPEARFANCKQSLSIQCPHCDKSITFSGGIAINVEDRSSNYARSAFHCATRGCRGMIIDADDEEDVCDRLCAAIRAAVRQACHAYYTSPFRCSDSGCGLVTRDCSARSTRCLRMHCQGKLMRSVTPQSLYQQICWFNFALDVQQQRERVAREDKRRTELRASNAADLMSTPSGPHDLLPESHQRVMERGQRHVDEILQLSAYHWVVPTIFATSASASKQPHK